MVKSQSKNNWIQVRDFEYAIRPTVTGLYSFLQLYLLVSR